MEIYKISNRKRARKTALALGPLDVDEVRISSYTGRFKIKCRDGGHDFFVELDMNEARGLSEKIDDALVEAEVKRRGNIATRSFLK